MFNFNKKQQESIVTKELLDKELQDYKANIEKQKFQYDKELALYKKEQQLGIDKDIQDRKVNNWKDLDDVRLDCYNKMVKLKSEIASLEGKRDALKTDLDKTQSDEIVRLNNIILKLIESNETVVCKCDK